MDFYNVINKRRTIRDFSGESIDMVLYRKYISGSYGRRVCMHITYSFGRRAGICEKCLIFSG